MSNQFCQVYAIGSEIENAFLLVDGDVLLFINDSDKYAVKGNNFIFGAAELILQDKIGYQSGRLETAIIHKESVIKKLPREKFFEGLTKYSFVLNVSMVLAKSVLLTNEVIKKYSAVKTDSASNNKQICLGYYKIIEAFKEEYNKRKTPWMKEFLGKYETSLTYKQGEIFFKAEKPVKIEPPKELSSKMKEYPSGSEIIKQGESGNDMLILQDGVIDVVVNGNKVASLSDPGTPIGEIALLLGEKRSASLVAKNNVVATRLTKADLKEVSGQDMSVLRAISESLALKHYNNITKISEVNSSILSDNLDEGSEEAQREKQSRLKRESEFISMKKNLEELIYKQKADFLKEKMKDLL